MFGDPGQWPDQDLIGFSYLTRRDFNPDVVIEAYRCGVFPMPLVDDDRHDMGWWSPLERGILPIDRLRVSRSLRKSIRSYRTTIDSCFETVMERCADPGRPGGWIDDAVKEVYLELHQLGVAHSVETWDMSGRLAGGLYGVSIGGLFAGESMFHDPLLGRDASKVALVGLGAKLAAGGCVLLDVQWVTPHLASLGAMSIGRREYLEELQKALSVPEMPWNCPADQDSSFPVEEV